MSILIKNNKESEVVNVSYLGSHFTYNNISSETYGLILAQINTREKLSVGGDLDYYHHTSNYYPKKTIIDFKPKEEITTYDVEIISEDIINDVAFISILNWLNNQPNYRKLRFSTDEYIGYHFNCIFRNIEKILAGGKDGYGIYGFKATIECDSDYMWADELVSQTYSRNQLIQVAEHINESMLRGYTYPTLSIKTGTTGGDITIQNVSINNLLVKFEDLLPNETITMKSYPKTLTSSLRQNVFPNLVNNKNWFKLIQGKNNIGIVGDVSSITITYEKARLFI